MKVLFQLTELDPIFGGPTYSVPLQAYGVSEQGVDTSFLTFENNSDYCDRLVKGGVNIQYVERPSNFISRYLYAPIKRYLSSHNNYDIYHSHGVWLLCNHWHASYSRKFGKAYVLNPRGDLQVKSMSYNRWKQFKKMIAWNLYAFKDVNRASCIIATSEQERDAIRRLKITAPIAVVPNGIDLSQFPDNIAHHHNDKKVAMFLGRVNPIKGLDYLIDAWASLPKEILERWELHIAGNSDPVDYIQTLQAQVAQHNLQDNIKFVGQVVGDEKIKKYCNTDLFILPSHNENFSNVVAEALMCGCPIITTQGTPWKSAVDNKFGWWIPLSRKNLTETIMSAASLSDEERWQMGQRGRNFIVDNYSLPTVSMKIKTLYKWVLGQGSKPDFVQTVK